MHDCTSMYIVKNISKVIGIDYYFHIQCEILQKVEKVKEYNND